MKKEDQFEEDIIDEDETTDARLERLERILLALCEHLGVKLDI